MTPVETDCVNPTIVKTVEPRKCPTSGIIPQIKTSMPRATGDGRPRMAEIAPITMPAINATVIWLPTNAPIRATMPSVNALILGRLDAGAKRSACSITSGSEIVKYIVKTRIVNDVNTPEKKERSQEFRKCIECYMCQNVCHVIRDHEENKKSFAGPRFLMRMAELDMHPLDQRRDRKDLAQEQHGLGFCNITKCCTEVCPEHIKITDNALIPLKERVVDMKYDPIRWLGSKILKRDDIKQN